MTDFTVKLNNGVLMPQLGLGTWLSDPGQVQLAVEEAIKTGYRHIDCAFLYLNEHEVGKALKQCFDQKVVTRQEMFITSKLWNTFHHPEDVEPAFRKSLDALGLDYIDLYLIHWPTAFKRGDELLPTNEDKTMQFDTQVSNVDTWKAMEQLVRKGLVKSIGLSNFNSVQIQKICDHAEIRPVINQVECHPYLNQKKLIQFCKDRDIVVTAYSPLGAPDRPWAKPDDPKLQDDPKLKAIATKHSKSPAQVLIRWQLQRGVVVIPKSVTPSRIRENFDVFDFSLSDDEMGVVDSFDCNGRLIVPVLDGKPRDGAHPDYPFHIEF